jgi:hypothetical protein
MLQIFMIFIVVQYNIKIIRIFKELRINCWLLFLYSEFSHYRSQIFVVGLSFSC